MRPREPHDVAGLRVVQVVATTTGGTGAHVRLLTEHLNKRGADVLVCGPLAAETQFGFSGSGARFAAVPIGSLPHPRDFATIRRLRRDVAAADVVHAHSLRAAALAGLATPIRVPFVVTRHNAILATGRTRRVHETLERYTARRAAVTLCVSSDLVDAVRRAGGNDVRRAFVTAPPMPPPRRDRESVRRELRAGDRPLVLAIGRLHAQKDYPTLVAAAGRLRELAPTPLVVVAGDGPERDTLEVLIDSSGAPVRLLGNRTDVSDLLHAADVQVLSSVWEGSPLSVQEGLRVGLPFVGTRVGSIPDIVADAGLLVGPHDVRALAVQLRRVLTDPVLAQDLRQRARRRAGELPGDDAVVEQVVNAYAAASRLVEEGA